MESVEYPKVGVIIPCHNYGNFLIDALESVRNQSYSGEIYTIVVDDGSNDDTRLQFMKDKPKDSFAIDKGLIKSNQANCDANGIRLRYEDLVTLPKPTGPSNARNVGIELAFKEGCEIIAFLDADDIMVENKIYKLVPLFNNLEIGAVYADYYHLYDDGTYMLELKEIYDGYRFLQENIGPNCTSLVRKEALLAVKEDGQYFDVSMRTCEDYDLFMRISEKYFIKHIAEPLTFLRVHDENSTNTVNKQLWINNRRRVSEKIAKRKQAASRG